jgi:hypothetical protein
VAKAACERAYDDCDALEETAVDAWQKAALDADLMKTVCAARYLELATSNEEACEFRRCRIRVRAADRRQLIKTGRGAGDASKNSSRIGAFASLPGI